MADPENFEDDLFDDLYDDNEASVAPAQTSAPAPAVPAPPKPPPPVEVHVAAQPEVDQTPADVVPMAEENGYGDEYPEENYDDDDDVDFNLGNGPSSSALAPSQQEVSTPTYHTTRGPSAKEDGTCALVH
ncbi:hypothetical protein F4779DRAFT_335641 [Xylariaceae sp. FL0662B]|nr:hypothetical protein F4779DRAFT_335641 [Xylariaceae sp. FL0662B]